MNSSTPELSLIIPCYNESQVLPLLRRRLVECLSTTDLRWEVILVDDGSQDDTFEQILAMHTADPRFKVLAFSRNFGHQNAVLAGLSRATSDFVAILDADLQDPPEFVIKCLAKLEEGYDVVYAVRRQRKENVFKRMAYAAFYRILKMIAEVDIPLDSGDFCVMRQSVAAVLRTLPERDVFVRGLRAWTGFRQVGLEYEREARAAGQTKYPLRKLIKLALDGVFAFSSVPLRLAVYLGFGSVALSIIGVLFIIIWKVFNFQIFGYYPSAVRGWTSLVCLILFLSGMQFLILGILGEFVRRVYAEVKQRPRWILRAEFGFTKRETHD